LNCVYVGSITTSDMEGGKTPVGMISELINILSIDRKKLKNDTPGVKPCGTKNEGNNDIYICIYVCMYMCTCICIYMCLYIYLCICIYIFTYMCIKCVYICMHTCNHLVFVCI
jgi:hypothetical protein